MGPYRVEPWIWVIGWDPKAGLWGGTYPCYGIPEKRDRDPGLGPRTETLGLEQGVGP